MVQEIMKPLVYFDFEEYDDDKNLILVSKDRLKEILEEVYQAGYSDGSNCRPYTITTPWDTRGITTYCNNVTTPQPREIHSTGSPIPRPDVVITCNNAESK